MRRPVAFGFSLVLALSSKVASLRRACAPSEAKFWKKGEGLEMINAAFICRRDFLFPVGRPLYCWRGETETATGARFVVYPVRIVGVVYCCCSVYKNFVLFLPSTPSSSFANQAKVLNNR